MFCWPLQHSISLQIPPCSFVSQLQKYPWMVFFWESQAKLHKKTAADSYLIQFSLANLAWKCNHKLRSHRLVEKYLHILLVPGCPHNQLLIGREKQMQNITLPWERSMWVQVATWHQNAFVLQWRATTVVTPTANRSRALLHRLYTIPLSLAQSKRTVLAALGPCIQSAGGHRCVTTSNENTDDSEITWTS